MKKRILPLILCLTLFVGMLSTTVFATSNNDDVVILYENDVHCAIDGYSKLAALKNELKQSYAHVGVVSSGDYIQGSTVGILSKGEYPVRLMNLVGYDAVALGNHEFDYRLDRLGELVDIMDTKPICCNFEKIGDGKTYFDPFSIVSYGETKIAYVGVTTPSTISSTSPTQFKDEEGNYIFTFHPNDVYEVVQKTVQNARSAGADYVIVLSHIGDNEPTYDIEEMIGVTSGIDVVLDAHSHSVISGKTVKNSSGEDVVLSSTGTKFEHIGKLVISDSGITTELIKTAELTSTDPIIDAYLEEIEQTKSELGDRQIGVSNFDLITHDENGNRIIRLTETNLGDLCADAFRTFNNADISLCNGGGLRSPIKAGKITFNDLLNVLQYNNKVVLVEVSGQAIKDMIEQTLRELPGECGSFPHVSGITFSVNTSIPTSVVNDENENFVRVDGQYRVYDLKVFNRESGEYEPMDLSKNYTLSSTSYYLLESGGGMTMFKDAKILSNNGTLDVEVLEFYITDVLGGVIGEQYATVQKNITFTDGEITQPENDPSAPTPDLPEPSAPQTEATEAEETDGDTEKKQNEGCGSTVSITVVGVAAMLGTALLIKKRKD